MHQSILTKYFCPGIPPRNKRFKTQLENLGGLQQLLARLPGQPPRCVTSRCLIALDLLFSGPVAAKLIASNAVNFPPTTMGQSLPSSRWPHLACAVTFLSLCTGGFSRLSNGLGCFATFGKFSSCVIFIFCLRMKATPVNFLNYVPGTGQGMTQLD